MSDAEMRMLVRSAFEDIGQGSPATFLELLDPDVVYTLTGTTALSGTFRGRDEVLARLLTPLMMALATPLRFEVGSVTVEGDRVAIEARGHATLRSGVPYDNTYCFVLRFAGERVVELTEYLDTALVARAFAVPAERTALVHAMDLNMWAMLSDAWRHARGSELYERSAFTMHANPRGQQFHNMVLVRATIAADELLGAIRDFHGRRELPFSVWTRAHADAELEAALRGRGFTELLTLPGMALLGDPGTCCEPPGLEIRAVTNDQGRRDYLEVTAEAYSVYGQPREVAETHFVSLESLHAPHVQGFVGYHSGAPVAAALVYVSHGVAGINWVGTVSGHRRARFAEAITWRAVREGFRRGAAFANLQASPMGRPVYERMGFITPTQYRVLVGAV
jgi:ketosteroid isomerase-like protein